MKFFGKLGIVIFTLSACAAAVFFDRWLDLRAQRVKPAELYASIDSQLDAVRRDDIRAAYLDSASGFRENFSFAEFKQMVLDDLAGAAASKRIEFGAVQVRDRRAIVQVFFIDAHERVTPCIYSLVNETGEWKVNSARLLKRWEPGERLDGIRG
jgi:Domain of unknown function (DUF4864)